MGIRQPFPTNLKSFTVDGKTYSFTDKSYWYTYENVWNNNARGVVGAAPVIDKSGKGWTDEYGNYWIAVGPNVVNPNHKSTESITPNEMFGRGKLDVVVKDSNGKLYYIPAVVGDAKAHTWSNGIVQTWKSYPNGTLYPIDGTSYNGLVCAEFIGDLKGSLTGLGKYSIEKIIFYEY